MASLGARWAIAPKALARNASIEATAYRYAKHGNPSTVLRAEKIKLDSAAVGQTDVLVKMLASPITRYDLATIRGFSGEQAGKTAGNEGVGIVEHAGSAAGLKQGDVVVACRPGVGTWSTHVIAPVAAFSKINLNGVAPEIAAAAVAPFISAQHLLKAASLAKGDTIVQNNAGSAVGQAVVQVAAQHGLRTLNIVQSNGAFEDVSTHLKAFGGSVVISDAHAARYEFVTKVLADLPKAKLGLNGAGGAAASAVARALAPGSTMVTYDSNGKPVSAPLSWFTQQALTLQGFNLAAKLASMPKAELDKVVEDALAQVAAGKFKVLVAREPAKDFELALKRALSTPERQIVLHW